jgi:hypothetical protein
MWYFVAKKIKYKKLEALVSNVRVAFTTYRFEKEY